jgi:hypothetical protein
LGPTFYIFKYGSQDFGSMAANTMLRVGSNHISDKHNRSIVFVPSAKFNQSLMLNIWKHVVLVLSGTFYQSNTNITLEAAF